MKILIVDDDELTLNMLSHFLKGEGYDAIVADDVAKALNIVENEKIDLIISDIMMPNVSGLGLLSLLKNFYLDKIPVILISSLDKGEIVNNALELGAACFLSKPVDLKALLLNVKNVLR